jgi:hypothetical protein
MDIWHWWLAKLAAAQVLYLFAVIWGMRYLNQRRLARSRIHRAASPSPLAPAAGSAGFPFQKQ